MTYYINKYNYGSVYVNETNVPFYCYSFTIHSFYIYICALMHFV